MPNYDDGTSLWGQQQQAQQQVQQQTNQQQAVQQQQAQQQVQQQQQPVPMPQNRTGLPVFKGENSKNRLEVKVYFFS